MKSYIGSYIFVNGNLVSWLSKKHKLVATSSCKADEYVATYETVKCVLHLYHILTYWGLHAHTSCLSMCTSTTLEQKHTLRKTADPPPSSPCSWLDSEELSSFSLPRYVPTTTCDNTAADILTNKALPRASHDKFTQQFLTSAALAPIFLNNTSH